MRVPPASLLVLAACGYSPAAAPVSLRSGSHGGEAILAVVPAGDLRINARVPPTIELAAGGMIRVARGRVSEDSSYYLEAPWELRPPVAIRGTLRVSYCRSGESVCRAATLAVDLSE